MTTDEIITEYKDFSGIVRRIHNGSYIRPYGVDETHIDENGDKWFIISALVVSLDNWLLEQCDSNAELCGNAPLHPKWDRLPRYNIHESLLSFITLRWG